MRGAERTFAEIAACWPEAPIYTTLYSAKATYGALAGRDISTSRMQRLGLSQRGFRRALPLYADAVGWLPVENHQLIVSSSSAFAHHVRPSPGAIHACYCHTPFRYAWHERERALAEVPRTMRPGLRRWLVRARRQDLEAAARVSGFIANSELTRSRIAAIYGRNCQIVHPPVEVGRFERPRETTDGGEHFLVVSELVAHKRVEVAIKAAAVARVPLVIVGDGPERASLEALAGPEVVFRGRVTDEEIVRLYCSARAVIVTAVEEFGIVAVEAQAAGVPVIAPAAGGASETVLHGASGLLLDSFDPGRVAAAISRLESAGFNPRVGVENARRFAPERFRERLVAAVSRIAESSG